MSSSGFDVGKSGAWNRLWCLPLFMLMAPLPTAMWVGLSNGTMPIPEAIQTALLQCVAALVAWAAVAIAIRSMTQAAVLLAPPVMLWFSFGSLVSEPTLFQVVGWFAVALAIGVALTRVRWGREIVFLANVLTAAWLLQPAWLTASFVWRSTPPRDLPQQLVATVPKERLPHIVHIVMDGFPASKVLQDVHGIDNSGFTGSLEKLGFKIIPDARSNYGFTLMSLASVFEMHTIEPLIAEMARKLDQPPAQLEGRITRMMLSRRLEHSPVMQALRASGYRFVAAETSYPRAVPGGADERWGPAQSWCEFNFHQYAIHRETPLVALCEARARQSLIYSRHHTLLQAQADAPPLETWREPTYFYEHILAPHGPFVVQADGSFSGYEARWEMTDNWLLGIFRERIYRDRFPPLVQWITTAVVRQVSEIAGHTDRPVVILIHGDHGSGRHSEDLMKENCHSEKFSPFLAVYSSDGRLATMLPDDADLAMLFQAVLSTQLGIQVPMRRSPSYFASWETPGKQIELNEADLAAPCSSRKLRRVTAGATRTPHSH
jgi:hypothetical protein